MKIFTTVIAIAFLFFYQMSSAQSTLTFHDYTEVSINGDTIDFSQYYGKKVMVVNTASFCAYTPQFAGLEDLYTQYNQYNFEIIGFPCNDFGSQDPHNDSTINEFCIANYGVTFLMMSKIATVSADTAEVFKWLQRADLNGVADAHVTWNFNKFLIDEAGHWVNHFPSAVEPLDTAITNWILSPSVISGVSSAENHSQIVQLISAESNSIELLVNSNSTEKISINIFSCDGKFVGNIFNGIISPKQNITYSTASLASGIYLIRMQSSNESETLKYALVK